jgi:hypothetical protein
MRGPRARSGDRHAFLLTSSPNWFYASAGDPVQPFSRKAASRSRIINLTLQKQVLHGFGSSELTTTDAMSGETASKAT